MPLPLTLPALAVDAAPADLALQLFAALAAILVAAKLAGALAARIGQPAVLGELVAGVLLGASVLGVVPAAGPLHDLLHVLAEFGVLLLLFEIGLETDLAAMFRTGPAALAVACVGVAAPFALATAYWTYFPVGATGGAGIAAVFVGATLTATSVGITARVLSDLGALHGTEARIIIGAAVLDDILGLVILGVVTGLASGVPLSAGGVSRILLVAVGFLVAAVVVGRRVAPRAFAWVERLRVSHALTAFALAAMLGLAALAHRAGSAPLIGAFAAGLVLSGVNAFDTILDEVRPVAALFTPIFFVSVGASVDLALLAPGRPGAGTLYTVALALTVLAIAGKVVAGWAAPWERYRRLVVGVGMIPRGEVGLIFADMGRRSGILPPEIFGAVLLMVMVTTFIAPPLLTRLLGRPAPGSAPAPSSAPE